MPSVVVKAESGLTLYAKPSSSLAVTASSPWGSDDVALTESGTTGIYSFTATDGQEYLVFSQAGGSPASTDRQVAAVEYLDTGASSSGSVVQDGDLPDTVTGDTFAAYTFTARDSEDEIVNLTGATITLVLTAGKRVVDTLTVGDGLSVVSASGGTFRIDEMVVAYEPTVLSYEAQVETSGGDVLTVAQGRWPILQDVVE